MHRPTRRGTDRHRAARYKGGARCECRVREISIHMAPRSKSLAESSTISGMRAAVAVKQPRLRSVQKRLWGFRSPHS